ncbi:hypothetical protein M7I_7277 [Glarea lozoyensis 74030]|uniref:Uncharacterized protein n=1 Tax=Glarea lozoyensis (strain ATCC 74030 / MF5533) TaxID=1104152 RepID=H0EWV3_GLAL7|nr:hypothetical protein M7I_7277 [Glarea lozoyensis 74030]
MKFLEELHGDAIKAIGVSYKTIYDGVFPVDGEASLAAAILEEQNWLGEGGTRELLRGSDISGIVEAEAEKLLRYMAGQVLSLDENVVTCGYFDEICAIDQTRPGFKHNDFSDGLFCPIPGSKMKCMSARLYQAANDLFIIGSTALNGIPSFAKANPEFNWEYKDFMIGSSMDTLGPGSKFALLCHLGFRWPKQDEFNVFQAGADPACGEYMAAVETMSYDQHMRFACTSPLTAAFRHKMNERLYMKYGDWIDPPSDMCAKWLKKFPVAGMPSTKESVSSARTAGKAIFL